MKIDVDKYEKQIKTEIIEKYQSNGKVRQVKIAFYYFIEWMLYCNAVLHLTEGLIKEEGQTNSN